MKKFLSTENIVRGAIVIVLIAYASTKYGLENVILGLLTILGMTLLGGSIVRLYQEIVYYLKTKTWELSRNKTLIFISISVLTPVLFLILLPWHIVAFAFLIVGILLLILLIFDIIKKLI